MVGTGENSTRSGGPSTPSPHSAGIQPYYALNAEDLGQRYESVSFKDVHKAVLDLLPPIPAKALDVGAGTGRDAAALAERGYEVVAVEPVNELRQVAQHLHPGEGIRWATDALPALSRLEGTFDLVLLSAVWMHLPPSQREQAMERLTVLLAPSGLLVVSLRRGDPPTDRMMFDVPAQEVVRAGEQTGLQTVRVVEEGTDQLGRATVWWQTVALRKEGA
ncbi:class I SAM-dependent methyltransferase [Streptomyces sp. NPDC127077]|uniref:class I SAM-dependent methyltransferase n=1 Tax=Streptomyces sp. NPDC127077 TaxID=3347131 RepID=UPI003665AD33